ncbi:thermonuclease family protein [Mycoplasma sp. Z386]
MRKILGKILFIFFLFFNFFIVSCSIKTETKTKTYFVNSVYDGDTFTDNKNQRYRFFGIDAPEIKDRDGVETKGNKHYYALLARNFLRKQIDKKEIQIQIIKKDKYKRNVSKIFINNIDIGRQLLRNGLVIVRYISIDKTSPFYTEDIDYYDQLLSDFHYAQKNKLGFWKFYSSQKEVEKALY